MNERDRLRQIRQAEEGAKACRDNVAQHGRHMQIEANARMWEAKIAKLTAAAKPKKEPRP